MSDPTNPSVSYHEFSAMRNDITDMKSLMSKLVEAMNRITVLEERQHVQAQSSAKSIERMEEITERLHQHEINNAIQASLAQRTTQIEAAFREIHVENERSKARFETVVWMVRGLWAVAIAGGAAIGWLVTNFSHLPVPGVK